MQRTYCRVFFVGLEKSPAGNMTVAVEPVQRQVGGSDCGFFAIAFLVEVLTGGDPKKVNFDQGLIRKHFFNCLVKRCWEAFPKKYGKVNRVSAKTEKFKVHIYSKILILSQKQTLCQRGLCRDEYRCYFVLSLLCERDEHQYVSLILHDNKHRSSLEIGQI